MGDLTAAAAAFRRSPLLPSAHLETIATVFHRLPPADYSREIIETTDHDQIALDYIRGEEDKPLLIMFHGMEGCSQSYTLRSLARLFSRQGWTVAVPHFRGCGGQRNLLPRAYHAADARDVGWMIAYCRAYFAHSAVFYIGVSLGGSALLHHLAGRDETHPPAVTISAPFDLPSCVQKIDQGINRRLYARHFLKSLRPKIIEKSRRFPSICDMKALKAARTISEFDALYTAPVHGYANAPAYWLSASARRLLPGISSPLLCVNALNDPLIPAVTLPPPPKNRRVFFCRPKQGGHSAFIGSPQNWLFDAINGFFQTHSARKG